MAMLGTRGQVFGGMQLMRDGLTLRPRLLRSRCVGLSIVLHPRWRGPAMILRSRMRDQPGRTAARILILE